MACRLSQTLIIILTVCPLTLPLIGPLAMGQILHADDCLCLCMCDEVAYRSKTFPTESNLCEDILILKFVRGNGAFD